MGERVLEYVYVVCLLVAMIVRGLGVRLASGPSSEGGRLLTRDKIPAAEAPILFLQFLGMFVIPLGLRLRPLARGRRLPVGRLVVWRGRAGALYPRDVAPLSVTRGPRTAVVGDDNHPRRASAGHRRSVSPHPPSHVLGAFAVGCFTGVDAPQLGRRICFPRGYDPADGHAHPARGTDDGERVGDEYVAYEQRTKRLVPFIW